MGESAVVLVLVFGWRWDWKCGKFRLFSSPAALFFEVACSLELSPEVQQGGGGVKRGGGGLTQMLRMLVWKMIFWTCSVCFVEPGGG